MRHPDLCFINYGNIINLMGSLKKFRVETKLFLVIGIVIIIIAGGVILLLRGAVPKLITQTPLYALPVSHSRLVWIEKETISGSLLISNPYFSANSPWSPDGLKFVYTAGGYLMVENIEKNTSQRLTKDKSYIETAAWSPDGRKIAYVSDIGRQAQEKHYGWKKTDVWVMNADGTNKRKITGDKLFNGRFVSKYDWPLPQTKLYWSPNGKQILVHIFVRPVSIHNTTVPPDQIWIASSDGKDSERKLAEASLFRWDDAGKKDNVQEIRYYDNGKVVTISTNGKIISQEKIANPNQFLHPERSKKVFLIYNTSNAYPKKGIWIANYDNTKAVRLIDDPNLEPGNTRFVWSPNGEDVLITNTKKGVWLVDSTSYNVKRIGREQFPDVAGIQARWSRDSKYAILFIEEIGGNYENSIWTMDKTGSQLKKISNKIGVQAAWSPNSKYFLVENLVKQPRFEISLFERQ